MSPDVDFLCGFIFSNLCIHLLRIALTFHGTKHYNKKLFSTESNHYNCIILKREKPNPLFLCFYSPKKRMLAAFTLKYFELAT